MNKLLKGFFFSGLLIVLISSLISFTPEKPSSGEAVNWVTVEEAMSSLQKEPRPVIIDVYTKWCGPCKMMSKNTFEDPRVAEYLNKNFYCVKFDAEGPDSVSFGGMVFKNPTYVPNNPGRNGVHEFTQYLQVSAYPTLVFLDRKGQYMGPVAGYRTPAQLEIFLKFFAEDKQLEITTSEQWQEYEKKFVPTWN